MLYHRASVDYCIICWLGLFSHHGVRHHLASSSLVSSDSFSPYAATTFSLISLEGFDNSSNIISKTLKNTLENMAKNRCYVRDLAREIRTR